MATLPNPNPIPNTADVSFRYTVNPSIPDGGSGNNTSNQVTTQINVADLGNSNNFKKAVDKNFAIVGDQLIYTITTVNTGNVTANVTVIADTIPNDTTFVPGSVIINNVPSGIAPLGGVLTAPVGNVAPGATATLVFRVTVNTIPNPNPIPDNARVTFTFTIDPSVPNGGTGDNLSNTVFTQVNIAKLNVTKTVDKGCEKVGGILTYIVTATNVGNTTAVGVTFIDTLPNQTQVPYIPGTLLVNGVPNGFPVIGGMWFIGLPNVGPGATTSVQYQLIVNTIPNPNPILDQARMSYNYVVDPVTPITITGVNDLSNIVSTTISKAIFGLIQKTSDKQNVQIGETITYTVTATNSGNTIANNAVVVDTIPANTVFVPGSVVINGIPVGLGPVGNVLNMAVGNVAPGATASISFRVVATTIPNPNPIPNDATINYQYTVCPTLPNAENGSDKTNIANVNVFEASFDGTGTTLGNNIIKTVDKTSATVGDQLLYIINATNTGNVTANAAIISDTIPNDTAFVPLSAVVNGVPNPILVPIGGVLSALVGNVAPGATASLAFRVTVTATVPNPNPIPDSARIDFTFTVDPTIPNGRNGEDLSNTVFTQISAPNFAGPNGLVKTSDKGFVQIGEQVTYTIVATNSGNVTATNVVAVDTIPTNTVFVPGSVVINNVPSGIVPIANVLTAPLGTIGPGASATLTFRVTVTTIPNPNPVNNVLSISYNFTADPSVPNGATGSANSNILPVTVSQASFGGVGTTLGNNIIKVVDKTTAAVGDQVLYTITGLNTGNVTAANSVIVDTIPNDTTFVPGSALINGLPSGIAPIAGVLSAPVGNVAAGATASLSFRVTINTIPNPNPIPDSATINYNFTVQPTIPNGRTGQDNTNTVFTQVNQATFGGGAGVVKSVDKTAAQFGDQLLYVITGTNTGNVTATNVSITDTIPNGTTFLPASAVVNGVPNPILVPIGGALTALMGNIAPGATTSLAFRVTITTTIPSPNPIPDNARIDFTYTVSPTIPNGQTGQNISNTVFTSVGQASFAGSIVKSSNKVSVEVGEQITYTINATNTGNITANNAVIVDTIPNNTTFVPLSVIINGLPSGVAPIANVLNMPVGTIAPGATASVSFRVTATTIPTPNPIPNDSTINYQFTVNPAIPNGSSGSDKSNIVNVFVFEASFGNTLIKTVDKAFAAVGDQLLYIITATNSGNATANNTVITDTIPNDTTFVPASAVVNGIPNVILTPIGGAISANTGIVAPGASVSLAFRVTVNTLPNPNPIPDNARINYTFTVVPTLPNGSSGENLSNTVFTQVNSPNFNGDGTTAGITKTADKAFVQIGDIITYTIVAKNGGNVTATNVIMVDTIPSTTTFVPNSAVVNNVPSPGLAPVGNVLTALVGNIAPTQSATLSFQVVVNTIPVPGNTIPNDVVLNYNFTANPAIPNGETGSDESNIVLVAVSQGGFNGDGTTLGNNFIKTVDKTSANVGDQLLYTITGTNTGNTTVNNTIITDTIPNDTTFVPLSAVVNGIPNPILVPIGGALSANVGSVGPGQTISLAFRVTVNTVPNPNPIPDNARINFTFTVDPQNPNGASGEDLSNTVFTQVNVAGFSTMIKTVDKAFADVTDILTYVITATNTGNTTAIGAVITDTIPNDTTFVPASAVVNGVPNPILVPVAGALSAPVGNVAPGATVSLAFRVSINTIPNPNPIPDNARIDFVYIPDTARITGQNLSNTVFTQVNTASFANNNKSADKGFAQLGEVITYNISATNTGNTTALNVVVVDTIPLNTTFVPNSVLVNGILNGAAPIANVLNIIVGSVNPNATVTISFRATVTTIPNPNPINNSATIVFNYTVDPLIPGGESGSNGTNIVPVTVSDARYTVVKTVDKAFAKIADQLLYVITTTNTGNATANNTIISDTIPNDTTFVAGSAVVNGVPAPGLLPIAGVLSSNVGNVAPGASASLAFRVSINTIPNPNPIPDSAVVNFTFTVQPTLPNGRNGSNLSNTVLTQVNQAIFGTIPKSADKGFANVGDTITYTITARNTGNVTATNVTIVDTIPTATTFVPASAIVNNVPNPGLAPIGGVLTAIIGNVAPGATATLVFRVTVTTVPNPNPILNNATINFNFTIDPAIPNGGSGSNGSSTVPVTVSNANVNLVKIVDKANAKVGDIITYTINATNNGNTTINNNIITDTIPNDTTFVPLSAVVNGIPSPGLAPIGGALSANVGSIAPGATASLLFRVSVNTVPNPNPIPDNARINFTFTVVPTIPNGASGENLSNTVFTQVNQANFGVISKTVDKAFADVSDQLLYIISATNTGNVTANNSIITDTIPNDTTFVPASAIVNGISNPILVPIGGAISANVGNVAPGATVSLAFRVSINTIPNPNPIPDNARIDFIYIADPVNPNGVAGENLSNTVLTRVNNATFGTAQKSPDKGFAEVGEVVTYNFLFTNTGNSTALNIVIVDTIPTATTFVPASVVVNGVSNPVIAPIANVLNIPVGSVAPSASATVSFRVTVTSIPNPNPINNVATINFNYTVDPLLPGGKSGSSSTNVAPVTVSEASYNVVKTVDKAFAQVADQLLYVITTTNNGNATANNTIISDTIPNDTTFVAGSAVVNGVPAPGLLPIAGVLSGNVGNVAPGASASLAFRVSINTIPNPNPIPDSAVVNFTFTVQPTIPNGRNGSNLSNTVLTQVNQAIFGTIPKSADKGFANIGDTITYTITAKNNGNVTATNVTIVDTIPTATTFVPASAIVNNVPNPGLAPIGGVLTANIGNVAPGATATLVFRVNVTTVPNPNPILNNATINFNFTVDPAIPNGGSGSNGSSTVPVTVSNANINLVKIVDKANAKVGDIITYTINATNNGNTTTNNNIITDTIPNDTTFVPASAVVNGIASPGLVPIGGALSALVGSIAPGATASLLFRVSVNTVPNPNPIPDNARINFTFTVVPTIPNGVSGENLSNTVFTQVNQANFGVITKTVDKAFADVSDQLLYIISATNTGNVTANNSIITDTIPNDTTFVPASAIVNGISNPILVPIGGAISANVGNVAPGATVSLAFRVSINTIPNPNPIPDNARIDFIYIADPVNPNGVPGENLSNTVLTRVNNATFGTAQKSPDKGFAEVGEIVTYNFLFTNTGNTTALNVVIVDTIPTATTFVPASVVVNGVPNPVIAPIANVLNIPVGSVAPSASATVSFRVTVTSVPNPNPINNVATINFNYTVDPLLPGGKPGSSSTNVAPVTVSEANYNVVKTVDKAFAEVSNQLLYIITTTNNGNATANNTVIVDTIPNDTTFVPASGVVNGVPSPGLVPVGGVVSALVGNIAPGASASLAFRVSINTIPNPNPIPDRAVVNFTFTVSPTLPNGRNGQNISNTVFTQVNDADLDSNHKSADKGFANIGDVITYTITAKNTGNVTANNISIVDTIPNSTTFVPLSVVINGVVNPGIAPIGNVLTIPVPPLAPNATTTISFRVTVTSIPNPNPINNSATFVFNFTIDPSIPNGGSDSTGTNTIPVTIANASFNNFTKTPSETSIGAGGILTYTLVAQNTGNVTANNVVIRDTIPNGTTFVPASAVVNNVPNPGLAPIGNVLTANMGSVAPGAFATLTFQVNVISIPNPNPIDNSGIINFNFIVDPNQPPQNGSNQSTHAITQVTSAILTVVKDTSIDFADLGDVTTYTITISNSGNTDAHNVLLTDAIQIESSFVPGSVRINNVSNPGANPNLGIPLSPILPGVPRVVAFDVSIDQVPFNSRVFNTATVAFSYTIPADVIPFNDIIVFGPVAVNVDSIATSNTTVILVQHAEVNSTKSADKSVTAIGDTITYTLVSTNNGNVTASNVVVSDPLSGGLSFVPGSVTVNAIPQPLANIVTGVNVGNLAPNAVVTTTFKALVTTTDTVVNQSLAHFTFIVDPNTPPKSVTIPSNTVTIVNNSPEVTVIKDGNTNGAILGDIIRYTIYATNTGLLDVTNVIVTDTLSSALSYEDNLTVNNVLIPGADITTGVNIGTLLIGATTSVAFDARVTTIPASGIITNSASAAFNYQIVPGGPILSSISNIFSDSITAFNASVIFTKVNDKQVIKINDTFKYTITTTNNGNITISNAVLVDTLPAGFIIQQTTIDGIISGGDITTGLPLGPIGINQTKTVVLTVLATTIPTPNPFINTVIGEFDVIVDPTRPPSHFSDTAQDTGITVRNPELTLTKGSDSPLAVVGSTVTYTITVANTGDVVLENVLVSDMLAPELEFISGSVTVNNIAQPLASIISGVFLGTMNVGAVNVIKFQAKVLSKPMSGLITNQSIGQYDFRLAPGFPLQPGSNLSNIYTIAVLIADLKVIKTTDAKVVSIGDTITYTVQLINDGDVALTNVLFKDDLPPNVALIDGSFTINGVVVNNVNLEQGVIIPVIPAGTTVTITYQVTVLSSLCNSKIINSASASFRFVLPNGTTGTGQTEATPESSTVVDVTLSNFKQFSVEEYLQIPCQKPDIENINAVKGSIDIVKHHVIQTAAASSNEGQKLNQHKLIVHGVLHLVVEYTACESTQGAHSAHYSIPFSTFVILPVNYTPGSNLDVSGMIEDIYYNDLDCRVFFTNTTIFLNVQILFC